MIFKFMLFLRVWRIYVRVIKLPQNRAPKTHCCCVFGALGVEGVVLLQHSRMGPASLATARWLVSGRKPKERWAIMGHPPGVLGHPPGGRPGFFVCTTSRAQTKEPPLLPPNGVFIPAVVASPHRPRSFLCAILVFLPGFHKNFVIPKHPTTSSTTPPMPPFQSSFFLTTNLLVTFPLSHIWFMRPHTPLPSSFSSFCQPKDCYYI